MPFVVETFLLIFGRVTGLFLSAPIFASKQIPGRIKVLVIVILAGSLAFFVPVQYGAEITNPLHFLAAIIVEIFIGYTIGFVVYILFGAIQLAGQLMDMQMGFGIVNVVDPQTGTQIPLLGNLTQTIALLLYLSVNGHHYLLQALAQSYKVIPVLGFNINTSFTKLLIEITAYMFIIAIKIAAPIIIAVLTTDIAMGFIARTVPQMNVFIVGLPLKILVGLIAFLLMLPVYIWLFKALFIRFFEYLDSIMMLMG
ncbi:MAG TPA: flagellar biosynthetic protein FliR [Syntrophomonadaceae bacterium]|nr:flagellar biosynthetic protein FliR [Syntrophomonadaceae bacterium]